MLVIGQQNNKNTEQKKSVTVKKRQKHSFKLARYKLSDLFKRIKTASSIIRNQVVDLFLV